MACNGPKIWRNQEKPYLCNVFFIVLDLRLTKDWLSGIDSLFLCYSPSISYDGAKKRVPVIAVLKSNKRSVLPTGLPINICSNIWRVVLNVLA